MKVWSVGLKYHIDTSGASLDETKNLLASRVGFGPEDVCLVSRGRNVLNDEDLRESDKLFALCKYSSVINSTKTVRVCLRGGKIDMRIGASILDLKMQATEFGLTDIRETTRQKVIVNGKVVPENMLLADIAVFVGSTRLSVSITSAGDELQETFSKDSLSNRLQKLPLRRKSWTTQPFRGLKRRRQRQHSLMPAFIESPTKIVRKEGTPVKAK